MVKTDIAKEDKAWFFQTCRNMAKRACGTQPQFLEDAAASARIAAWKTYAAGEPPASIARSAYLGAVDFLRHETGRTTHIDFDSRERVECVGYKKSASFEEMPGFQDTLRADDPYAAFLSAASFCALVELLPSPRKRLVLWLQYKEEMQQKEVAERLGVSPSRVSQLNEGALKSLRKAINASKQERYLERNMA